MKFPVGESKKKREILAPHPSPPTLWPSPLLAPHPFWPPPLLAPTPPGPHQKTKLAKFGEIRMAKCGQFTLAKLGLAKFGRDRCGLWNVVTLTRRKLLPDTRECPMHVFLFQW